MPIRASGFRQSARLRDARLYRQGAAGDWTALVEPVIHDVEALKRAAAVRS